MFFKLEYHLCLARVARVMCTWLTRLPYIGSTTRNRPLLGTHGELDVAGHCYFSSYRCPQTSESVLSLVVAVPLELTSLASVTLTLSIFNCTSTYSMEFTSLARVTLTLRIYYCTISKKRHTCMSRATLFSVFSCNIPYIIGLTSLARVTLLLSI